MHGRHDDRLHDRVTAAEQSFHEYPATIVREDIRDAVLRPADPDAAEAFILTTIGVLVLQATTTEEITATTVRTELERHLHTVPQA